MVGPSVATATKYSPPAGEHYACPLVVPSTSAAFCSNAAMSIFCATTLPALDSWLKVEGVCAFLNGLIGLSFPVKFNLSKASISASENWRRCLGRNGVGVETRDVKN